MDVIDTITHPWREPMDYVTLAFWVFIFLVFMFIIGDMLRILASWVKSTV